MDLDSIVENFFRRIFNIELVRRSVFDETKK